MLIKSLFERFNVKPGKKIEIVKYLAPEGEAYSNVHLQQIRRT